MVVPAFNSLALRRRIGNPAPRRIQPGRSPG